MTTKLAPSAFITLTILLTAAAFAGEDLPKTLLTQRGKLLVSEDFTQPLAPFTGTPVGFASGFSGIHGGKWDEIDGVFQGAENPEAHHPATASYGIDFKDAIIQCDVRLDDVPDEGRRSRYLQIKTTDTKDYVCIVSVSPGGFNGRPCDDAHINPATHQRMEGTPARAAAPIKLGEWHTVVLEIKGEEAVGTVDGKSVTFSDPLIGVDKHSIMFVAGTQGSFRHFRVWEALPNPDWEKNKVGLPVPEKK